MKKILVVASNSTKQFVKHKFVEHESIQTCKEEYLQSIDKKLNLELSYDDFKSYYDDLDERITHLFYEYFYYQTTDKIYFYNNEEEKSFQFFEVNEGEDFAIVTENKYTGLMCYVITEKIYDKLLFNINTIINVWNQLYDNKKVRLNWTDFLVPSELSFSRHQFFIEDEYLDYNTFDFSTGELIIDSLDQKNEGYGSDLNISQIIY